MSLTTDLAASHIFWHVFIFIHFVYIFKVFLWVFVFDPWTFFHFTFFFLNLFSIGGTLWTVKSVYSFMFRNFPFVFPVTDFLVWVYYCCIMYLFYFDSFRFVEVCFMSQDIICLREYSMDVWKEICILLLLSGLFYVYQADPVGWLCY